jgi:PAS domain S-box-containing protein
MTAMRDETGRLRGFTKVARDMTERMQAETALRESNARLQIALDAAQMGWWDWDIANDITTVDQRYCQLLGLDSATFQISYQAFLELIHPDDRAAVEQAIARAQADGKGYISEFRVTWPDGSEHWIASAGQISFDASGAAIRVTGVITDITTRKAGEELLRQQHGELERRVQERTRELAESNIALQREIAERVQAEATRNELVRQLVTAEEEERRRISRELHDQMGQQLTGLLLGLQSLKDASRGRGGALQTIEQLQRITDGIGREVHQLALELRPTALDDLGLSSALANYTTEWSQRAKVTLDFHSRGLDHARPSMVIATTLYRVVLEALNNVARHAQAKHVSVILERRDTSILAIVEDDGVGFDTEAVISKLRAERRIGVRGMQERMAQVGGVLTIESSPGNGTTVIIRVPVLEQAEG